MWYTVHQYYTSVYACLKAAMHVAESSSNSRGGHAASPNSPKLLHLFGWLDDFDVAALMPFPF